jgi:NAD(P)-dependent dehydrogenase (short-subunit alcohol dehydrogenase family)
MGALTGKTAVIASSGIGRAIALRLGEAGAHVSPPGAGWTRSRTR